MPISRENMTGQYKTLPPNSPIWEDRRAHVRITSLENRLDVFEKKLDANTVATQTTADNTTEIVQLIKGAKGLQSFIVWASPIVAVFAAIVTGIALGWDFLKEHIK